VKIDLALICDYALIDRFGKLSVMGIFEHIWITQFPTVHPRLHLVLRLKGRRTEIGQHAITIRLVDGEGTEILGGDGKVDFAEPPAGVTEIEAGTVFVFDVPLRSAGRYCFEITVDEDIRATIPMTVAIAPSGT
jgi:hypothetical protein